MRFLNAAEVEFCNLLGLDLGVDVDTQHPQLHHLCWPYASALGAICKTKYLWSHTGMISQPEKIECEPCLEYLAKLMHDWQTRSLLEKLGAPEQDLIKSHGELAREVLILREIEMAVSSYLWTLDNPDRALQIPTTLEAELQNLRDVVRFK